MQAPRLSAGLLLTLACYCSAQDTPQKYRQFFARYSDSRAFPEKVLNSVGLTSRDVGRSFALIAGVASYPGLPERSQLPAAAEDVRKLRNYLETQEYFDEIVVLKDADVTYDNLQYFLATYFPRRLRSSPNSRFLFAYSGHGFEIEKEGYLVKSRAVSLEDTAESIPMTVVRDLVNITVKSAFSVLVLINACHSGAFISNYAGSQVALPKYPGAHAITAGGVSEKAWADSRTGSGSIFFEKLFDGLNGEADVYPKNGNRRGDGIVSVYELFDYLRDQVAASTPQLGYLARDKTEGGFFFLNRHAQVQNNLRLPWDPNKGVPFGAAEAWTDPSTGLIWLGKEVRIGINADAAEAYCSSEKAGGYTNWRLPTVSELIRLFEHIPDSHLPVSPFATDDTKLPRVYERIKRGDPFETYPKVTQDSHWAYVKDPWNVPDSLAAFLLDASPMALTLRKNSLGGLSLEDAQSFEIVKHSAPGVLCVRGFPKNW